MTTEIKRAFLGASISFDAPFILRELKGMDFEKIYQKIAEMYGVSVEEVKREIETAMAYSNANAENIDDFIQQLSEKVVDKVNQDFIN